LSEQNAFCEEYQIQLQLIALYFSGTQEFTEALNHEYQNLNLISTEKIRELQYLAKY
jgi:hypothetical protein